MPVGIAGLGVAVVSSLAFTPALASSHHHDAGGTDTHTATASGHDHGGVASGHQHGVTTLNGQQVKGVKAADVTAESQPDQPLDATTRATLKGQLTEARDFALRYPTVADATGAGYRLAGGFAPGSGAHYITYSGLTGAGAFAAIDFTTGAWDGLLVLVEATLCNTQPTVGESESADGLASGGLTSA